MVPFQLVFVPEPLEVGQFPGMFPEYQPDGLKAEPVIVPKTSELFHCMRYHFGLAVVP
jgi:hypothetical protein